MNPKDMSDAINQDVTDKEQPTLTSPESPRARALAAIEEGHRARMEEEMGMSLSDDKGQEEVEEEAPAAVEQAPAPGAFKVKVDGVEQEVSAEDLIRSYQKNLAADRRLEEATRILRDAEQLAAQQQVAEQEITQEVAQEGLRESLRKEASKMVSTWYDGDQEAATEALVDLFVKTKGGDQPTRRQEIDADVLAEQVLERMAFNSAVERVKSDYPDLVADSNLEQLVVMQSTNLVSSGVPRAEALLSVAESLYKSLGKTPTGRQQDTPKPKSARQENKDRLDNVPSASATATSMPVKSEEPDQSALIREVARRRIGQSLSA